MLRVCQELASIVGPTKRRPESFCRAMLCNRGLCRHAVSVRLSRSYILTKRIISYFHFFLPSGSQTILVFPHQTSWQYFDGTLPLYNGGVECRWGRQNSRPQPIPGSIACCELSDRQVQYTQLRRTMAS